MIVLALVLVLVTSLSRILVLQVTRAGDKSLPHTGARAGVSARASARAGDKSMALANEASGSLCWRRDLTGDVLVLCSCRRKSVLVLAA